MYIIHIFQEFLKFVYISFNKVSETKYKIQARFGAALTLNTRA